MPGGRLTEPERRQIASGLAEGLAYAEIARGLDRPTSTITREVMRNGGPTGYRADLAHRATERRAHRRRPAAPRSGTTPPPAHASGRDPEALREYEEAFVVLMIESGLPKMMSRVLCYMYMTDSGSVTAAELVEHLQVSPASVSKAVAVLETQALIRRERDERRRERYLVDQDVWYQSMIASAKSAADLAEAARKGVGVLGPGTPAGQRMRNIARFVDFVAESTYRAAEQARDILYEKPATEQEGEPAARQERDAAAGDSAS